MIEEKAEKILYRLRDDLHISFSEFNYLMNLLKYGKGNDIAIADLTPLPRGYEAWREKHKHNDIGLQVKPIPQSKL